MNINQIDFRAAEVRQAEMRRELEKQRLIQLARQVVKVNHAASESALTEQVKHDAVILRPRAT